MKNTVTSKLALAAAAVALGAGGLYAAIVGGSAATVNGEPILNSEYEKNLASVIEQYQKSMKRGSPRGLSTLTGWLYCATQPTTPRPF